jgi:hypothetical protein
MITDKIIQEDGSLHPSWQAFFNQIVTQMQTHLSDEGYKVPQQKTATITTLATGGTHGALLYDSDLHQLKVNINGTFKTINVT